MRAVLTMTVGLTMAASFAALASDTGWTPNAKDIARLESVLDLSRAQQLGGPPPEKLAKYARFYAGVVVHDHKMIRGVLLLAPRTRIEIVPEKGLPAIMDGGCGIINLLYDPKSARVVWITCNGLA
jgi:hypothetical protein